jgi:hypothetical protein
LKTLFDEWMQRTEMPLEAEVAFSESSLCYKAGAFRAAVLFGYVGFMLVLRSRILSNAAPPPGFTPEEWRAFRTPLLADDKWDAKVFDATQMRPNAAGKRVFDVPDDMRVQVQYWKDRRNDCAHYKDNEIAQGHVDAIWLFVRSSFGRFVVVGGRDGLAERIVDHFDPNRTPPGQDLMPLVADLPACVAAKEMGDFFADVTKKLTRFWIANVSDPASLRNVAIVYDCALRLDHSLVSAVVVGILVSDWEAALRLLEVRSSHVQMFRGNPQWIRELWRTRLFGKERMLGCAVLASMIRHGLIPACELQEAVQHAAGLIYGSIPDAGDVAVLEQVGLFSEFSKVAFGDGGETLDRFNWGNGHAMFLAWYFLRYGVDDVAAVALSNVFQKSKYFPNEACAALKELFAANPAVAAGLLSHVQAKGLPMPDALF